MSELRSKELEKSQLQMQVEHDKQMRPSYSDSQLAGFRMCCFALGPTGPCEMHSFTAFRQVWEERLADLTCAQGGFGEKVPEAGA